MRRTIALGTAALTAVATGVTGAAAAAASGGHAAAVTEAKSLVAQAPAIAGSTSQPSAPTKALATAPPNGYRHLVSRRAYWTVDESARAALHSLTAGAISGLTLGGSGYTSSGNGKKPARRVYYAQWFPTASPTDIAWAALEVEVVSTGSGTSAIAAFGQAVAAPPRPADEIVPTTGVRVRVALRNTKGHVVRGNHVAGAAASTLIADFSALSVVPPGAPPRPCPLDSGRRELVSFSWTGHVMRVSSGFCGYVEVTGNGHALKTLNDGGNLDHDIRSDLAPPKSPR